MRDFCVSYLNHSFFWLKYITILPRKIHVCIQRDRGRQKADESDLHVPLTCSFCVCREN